MSDKYRVLVVGMGKRGMHHALAFQANNRFEVAGVCDIDASRLEAVRQIRRADRNRCSTTRLHRQT